MVYQDIRRTTHNRLHHLEALWRNPLALVFCAAPIYNLLRITLTIGVTLRYMLICGLYFLFCCVVDPIIFLIMDLKKKRDEP